MGYFKFNGIGGRVRFYLSIIISTFASYIALSVHLYKTTLLWVVVVVVGRGLIAPFHYFR